MQLLLIILFLFPVGSVKPKTHSGHLYTLIAAVGKDGNSALQSTPSYLVGPKKARDKHVSLMLRYSHDLEKAKSEHRRLARQVDDIEASTYLSTADTSNLQILKKKKLKLKDQIAHLSKWVVTDEPTSALFHELGAGGIWESASRGMS